MVHIKVTNDINFTIPSETDNTLELMRKYHELADIIGEIKLIDIGLNPTIFVETPKEGAYRLYPLNCRIEDFKLREEGRLTRRIMEAGKNKDVTIHDINSIADTHITVYFEAPANIRDNPLLQRYLSRQ